MAHAMRATVNEPGRLGCSSQRAGPTRVRAMAGEDITQRASDASVAVIRASRSQSRGPGRDRALSRCRYSCVALVTDLSLQALADGHGHGDLGTFAWR